MRSSIFDACREGNEELTGLLMQQKPSCLEDIDQNERIPLHEACRQGHLNVVRLLVGGSSLRKSDFDGNIPLHYAACSMNNNNNSNNNELVKLLCENDQSLGTSTVYTRNSRGKSPLHLAAQGGHADIVDTLLFYDSRKPNGLRQFDKEGRLPMHYACQSGNLETVQRILQGLKKGAFQVMDEDGLLPLHHACFKGSLDLIAFLVEEYPEAVQIRTKIGHQLPLDIALAQGQSRDVIEFLKEPSWLDQARARCGRYYQQCAYSTGCHNQCLPLHHRYQQEMKKSTMLSRVKTNKVRIPIIATVMVVVWMYWLRPQSIELKEA